MCARVYFIIKDECPYVGTLMIVNADLYVKDLPGQLVGSLEPISLVDGNIMGVVHNREQIVNHRICLNVTFEVECEKQLETLQNIWKSKDVVISRIGSVCQTFPMDYLLIGKFDALYIEELMKEASKNANIINMDVRYSSKSGNGCNRTAMISVKTGDEDSLDKLEGFLRQECGKADITYVRGI